MTSIASSESSRLNSESLTIQDEGDDMASPMRANYFEDSFLHQFDDNSTGGRSKDDDYDEESEEDKNTTHNAMLEKEVLELSLVEFNERLSELVRGDIKSLRVQKEQEIAKLRQEREEALAEEIAWRTEKRSLLRQLKIKQKLKRDFETELTQITCFLNQLQTMSAKDQVRTDGDSTKDDDDDDDEEEEEEFDVGKIITPLTEESKRVKEKKEKDKKKKEKRQKLKKKKKNGQS